MMKKTLFYSKINFFIRKSLQVKNSQLIQASQFLRPENCFCRMSRESISSHHPVFIVKGEKIPLKIRQNSRWPNFCRIV